MQSVLGGPRGTLPGLGRVWYRATAAHWASVAQHGWGVSRSAVQLQRAHSKGPSPRVHILRLLVGSHSAALRSVRLLVAAQQWEWGHMRQGGDHTMQGELRSGMHRACSCPANLASPTQAHCTACPSKLAPGRVE